MKNFKDFLNEIKKTESYDIEKAKYEFIKNINRIMKDNNISKTKLAHDLGTSKAYITKILKGDNVNFTIESMVKICRALGGKLHTHISIGDRVIARWTGMECYNFDKKLNQKSEKDAAIIKSYNNPIEITDETRKIYAS